MVAEPHTDPEGRAARRRVIVLVNPRAGRKGSRELTSSFLDQLTRRGFDAEAMSDLDLACSAANQAHAAGDLQAIVAAGGDGTIAEVINRTKQGVPITTLPVGTENLLARQFGIARSAAAVADVVACGNAIALDVGRATTIAGSRLFLLMVSAGLDAEIMRQLDARRSGNITHWSYLRPIWGAVRRYRYPPLRIKATLHDDAGNAANRHLTENLVARWVLGFNLPCYAGMLRFLHSADGADGMLDICRFDGGGFWRTLYYYLWVLLGRAERIRGRHVSNATRLRIDADEPVPFQIDGDPGGFLPVEVDILPRRLTLLVPKTAPGNNIGTAR